MDLEIAFEEAFQRAQASLMDSLGIQEPWFESLDIPVREACETIIELLVIPLEDKISHLQTELAHANKEAGSLRADLEEKELYTEKARILSERLNREKQLLEGVVAATREPVGDGFMIPARIDWISQIRRAHNQYNEFLEP